MATAEHGVMTFIDDSDLLAALDRQRDAPAVILAALDRTRQGVAPVPESDWTGIAARAYADALARLNGALDRAEERLRSALAHTTAALDSMAERV